MFPDYNNKVLKRFIQKSSVFTGDSHPSEGATFARGATLNICET